MSFSIIPATSIERCAKTTNPGGVYLPNRQSLSAMSLRTGVSKLSATSKEFQWQELCQTKLHLKIVLYVITALEFSVKTKSNDQVQVIDFVRFLMYALLCDWCI